MCMVEQPIQESMLKDSVQRCYHVHAMRAAVQETLQAMEDMVYIATERLVVHKEV